jgi:GNAT superfamily N-acetyltransferase
MNPPIAFDRPPEPALVASLDAEPDPADIEAIVAGLLEFNRPHTGGDVPAWLVASLRDSQGTLLGGLFGATYVGWLHVQSFWLPEGARGRGHGRRLLSLAEDEALRRGCARAFLETLSFQALPFYEKCGYRVSSRLEGFPPGGTRYALTKDLTRRPGAGEDAGDRTAHRRPA